jgi:5-(carboxyamino)imidazole ribonucleotide synthase
MVMETTRVGIIGAGQLGRMLALAGYPLGIECELVDRSPEASASQVAPIRVAALDDADALQELAQSVDVVTFDIENVAVDSLRELTDSVPVHPSPELVAVAQDRLEEKRLFAAIGIPTAPYVAVETAGDLDAAAAALSWPLVLKARRMGYDGRGQRVVATPTELARAWEDLGGVPAIAEAWMRFRRELSLLAARSIDGELAFYPLTENVHREGILSMSIAPVENADLQSTAEGWLAEIMSRFDYRGVLAVEFFETERGLVANEMAPRVHNSGHWTIEGAETSQFENHLRGVLGWPLGATAARGHAAMVNLIGTMPDRRLLLAQPGAHLHDYAKDPRPGRKLGHCTLVDASRARLVQRVEALREALSFPDQ